MKSGKLLDMAGLIIAGLGLVTSLNSCIFSFAGRVTGLPPLLLTLFIAGYLALLTVTVKPLRQVPLALYGFTAFVITFTYAYNWLAKIVSTGSYGLIPMFSLLLSRDLIYIPIALIFSIAVVSIRTLRTPVNVAFSSSFLKLFPISILISIVLVPIQGVLPQNMFKEGVALPKMSLPQMLIMLFILAIFFIIGLYIVVGALFRRVQEGYKTKKRFIHITESYPPIKIDETTFCKISDLHFRAYRIYRVYSGDLSQQALEALLSKLRKVVVFYALDGYVYIYTVAEAKRLGKAIQNLDLAHEIIINSLDVDIVKEESEKLRIVKEATIPRDLPEQIDRDKIRFLISDEAVGTVLVFEYEGSMIQGRFMPRKIFVKSGIYTITNLGKLKHLTELSTGYRISSAQAGIFCWELLKNTTPVRAYPKYTSLHVRKGHIHIDGGRLEERGINLPNVSIEFPLKHHMFLLGKSGSGKSTAIANIVSYINKFTNSKVIIFDWVGNFISLVSILRNATVLWPGEDIFVDLYRVFNKRELINVYEEAAILFFKDVDRASFSPIAYEMLSRAIESANSHQELIKALEEIREVTTYKDERDATSAVLRRLKPLTPELYTPIPDVEGDLIKLLEKHDVLIIDLASLPSEGDMILFTLACLMVLMRTWSSSKPELYVVIDEVHRLAPRIRGMREWILSKIAREGRKYNMYLILADQTLTTVAPDVWNNMGHVFLFHIDNPDDLRTLYPLFSAWEKRFKIHGDALRQFVDINLRLHPGECYLVRFGGESEPIPCYFDKLKLVETGQYIKIDEERFRRAVEEVIVDSLIMTEEQKRKSLITAKRLIRTYKPEHITKLFKAFCNDKRDVLKIGEYIIAGKENGVIKARLSLRIFLAYYGMLHVLNEFEQIKS